MCVLVIMKENIGTIGEVAIDFTGQQNKDHAVKIIDTAKMKGLKARSKNNNTVVIVNGEPGEKITYHVQKDTWSSSLGFEKRGKGYGSFVKYLTDKFG